MVNLFLLLLGLIGLIAVFFDNVVFLDAQKKVLNQKFEAWWKTVEHFDKLELALVCANKVNEILDLTFGKSHFSKKVFARCSIISTGILLITLSVLGMINRQPFGVAPWKAYSGSVSFILTTTDDLVAPSNYATFKQVNIIPIAPQINITTNLMLFNVNSNFFLMTMTTNGIYDITRFNHLGNGGLNIDYHRFFEIGNRTNHATNSFGRVTSSTNPHAELVNDIKELHHIVARYDTTSCIVAYSIGFYLVLFAVNAFMFIGSLAFCRTILREIAASSRLITTFSLVFTNSVLVFGCGCVLLLFLTLLAIPLFWLLIPIMYAVSEDSFYTVIVFLFSAAFALFMIVGNSAKIILFIALLPSLFAIVVGMFSLLAMKWRNGFHFIIKHLFIRCAQKNPFAVLIAIIGLVVGLIEVAIKFIHILGFV